VTPNRQHDVDNIFCNIFAIYIGNIRIICRHYVPGFHRFARWNPLYFHFLKSSIDNTVRKYTMLQHLSEWHIVPTCSIFLALATVAVTLRFISRYKFGVKIGPDDILILIALLFAYAHLIDVILCKHSAIQISVLLL
jgi:hypothetical protein